MVNEEIIIYSRYQTLVSILGPMNAKSTTKRDTLEDLMKNSELFSLSDSVGNELSRVSTLSTCSLL